MYVWLIQCQVEKYSKFVFIYAILASNWLPLKCYYLGEFTFLYLSIL
ncbi:protein of unknown function [Moritella yayanosii]|uniref:Uncharacterized protein n=1 Tax=Moritella yayanosii TaxID=69539 RepID=A0A330LP94_9GAMM|nr:protein of unknown function [Moritella yayanosii]